ncbi:MAG: hypothetical protein AB8G99_14555, partial [Planctomycetaceae bacterium]
MSWLAVCELDRIASDRLFLVGMSFESEASVPELYDARASAAEWRLPAIGGVVLTAVLLAGLNWK